MNRKVWKTMRSPTRPRYFPYFRPSVRGRELCWPYVYLWGITNQLSRRIWCIVWLVVYNGCFCLSCLRVREFIREWELLALPIRSSYTLCSHSTNCYEFLSQKSTFFTNRLQKQGRGNPFIEETTRERVSNWAGNTTDHERSRGNQKLAWSFLLRFLGMSISQRQFDIIKEIRQR